MSRTHKHRPHYHVSGVYIYFYRTRTDVTFHHVPNRPRTFIGVTPSSVERIVKAVKNDQQRHNNDLVRLGQDEGSRLENSPGRDRRLGPGQPIFDPAGGLHGPEQAANG